MPRAASCCAAIAQGDAAIPGFLDDYAFFTQALLDLYETQFDLRHLELAMQLTEKQRELFEDTRAGAFFSTAADDRRLVMRMKDDYDGAEPSGNSVAVMNLLRLAQMTNRADFPRVRGANSGRLRRRASAAPVAIPQMLVACEFCSASRADHPGRRRDSAPIHGAAAPSCIIALSPTASCCWWTPRRRAQALAAGIPVHRDHESAGRQATAYVCENYTCQLPVSDPAKFARVATI